MSIHRFGSPEASCAGAVCLNCQMDKQLALALEDDPDKEQLFWNTKTCQTLLEYLGGKGISFLDKIMTAADGVERFVAFHQGRQPKHEIVVYRFDPQHPLSSDDIVSLEENFKLRLDPLLKEPE